MKALLIVVFCVVVYDVALNHSAIVLGCWAILSELIATIRRGVWASA